ncbi:hypothetical protein XPA_010404 [Xanthoria parietina]
MLHEHCAHHPNCTAVARIQPLIGFAAMHKEGAKELRRSERLQRHSKTPPPVRAEQTTPPSNKRKRSHHTNGTSQEPTKQPRKRPRSSPAQCSLHEKDIGIGPGWGDHVEPISEDILKSLGRATDLAGRILSAREDQYATSPCETKVVGISTSQTIRLEPRHLHHINLKRSKTKRREECPLQKHELCGSAGGSGK